MTDVIEATSYVSIEDILVFVLDTTVYRFNRIVTGSSWAKAVAVAFKLGFPLWFKGLFGQCLAGPVNHGGNTKRALFLFAWFGYPHPSERFRLPLSRLVRVNGLNHGEPFGWWDSFHAINTGSFLPLVVLRHSSHR